MKVFSAEQLKQADRRTLEIQGISSDELMERAAGLVFQEIHQRLQGEKTPVKIFCGVGNNGGDGLVIGRLLIEYGYEVTVYIVNYSDNRSQDFLTNYDRIKKVTSAWPVLLNKSSEVPALEPTDLVVDAIFGIGLNRPLVDWVADIVSSINASGSYVLAVDLPSGMYTDGSILEKEAVIRANFTLTFQAAKLVFFLPETGPYIGHWKVLDIGLDREFLDQLPVTVNLVGKQEAKSLYRPREKFSHKGTYGHALLIGGSYGKMGSICLTARATLRSGAGMTTVFIPECGYNIVQNQLPEAMVISDVSQKFISDVRFDLEPTVICFGVGAGKREETSLAFEDLLNKVKDPMVIDADGLNLLAEKPELLASVPPGSVLTPHPRELERLTGSWKDDFDKLEKTRALAEQHQVLVVLKGAHTMIITDKEIFINTTGNPGMATAGSGDVLAGVITGLISQRYSAFEAAVLGVYLHGKAGDIAAGKLSFQGMIAGDITKHLGAAFLELTSHG